jgi:hypothetical protein
MMPVEQQLITHSGWQTAFYLLAGLLIAVMLPMAWCCASHR